MSLEEKLARIKTPNLQSQQHARVVLSSIEDTLTAQNTKFTPTAYFAALLGLLRQSSTPAQPNAQDEIVVSTIYLLDLVTSHVPPALLRTQFQSIVVLLAPFLSSSDSNAPLLRSSIGCLESLLVAQDSAAWALPQSQTGPRQAVPALLSLAVDSRPKIRKRAQEALTAVLKTPPPGPALDHPAAELCAVAAQNNLKNAVAAVQQAKRQKGRPDDSHEPALIHALQLVKTIATASGGWPSKKIEPLCELLLSISRSRNEYLVMSAFEVFELIFESMQDEVSSAKLPRLLESIVELKPTQNDSQLIPPWIAIVSRGYGTSAEVEPEDTFAKLPELFDLISAYLTNPSHNIRVSASECLISFFANCVPDSVISDPSIYDEKIMDQIASRALGLLAVKYQTAWMEVFTALSALFDAFRWRGDPFLLPIVKAIGELRGNEGFQGKKEADLLLGHAIRNLGPGAVMTILPHNLIKPTSAQPGRAWLLPLLRDHVSNTNIAHFKSDLVPLSEAMFQRVIDHGSAEKTMQIKIYETVVQQVWATFPGYCDLPLDLGTAMDQSFAEMIANLLYKQTELRADLCRGLQNLVESNQAIVASDLTDEILSVERRLTKADAERNLRHLSTFASNLLAVLFNVYSQTLPQSRAYILQCINAFLSVTPEKDLVETFDRVSKMLEAALPKSDDAPPKKEPQQQPTRDKLPPTSHTLLDLIIALSVHLPRTTFASLFILANHILNNTAIFKSDPQLIKKAYKLIPRLATSETGAEALKARNAELQNLIISTADKTPVPARRDRTLAIKTIVSFLPLTDLHFIPSIMSESVLACKDSNERARNAGFDLLIALTNKISDPQNPPDTIIRNNKVPHMADDSPDVAATLEEVLTMVSAGLAGVAPHMVAATITALSRLLFEFHDQVNEKTETELVDTVLMFLQSNNREIVRSVLGFVKVMVVVLPLATLEPRISASVPGLMVWSKENKGRMRVKVRGILDRCIRRYGADKVESWVGGDDRKMVVNIRKRRERSRRKNKGLDEDGDEDLNGEDDDAAQTQRGRYDNEFDQAVYGSEEDDSGSEIEGGDSDGDNNGDAMSGISLRRPGSTTSKQQSRNPNGRRDGDRGAQFIRQNEEDDTEPLDLLDPRSMANISSKKLARLKDTRKLKSKAKYNEDGKLVFGGGADSDDDDVLMSGGSNTKPHSSNGGDRDGDGDGGAVNAYLDAVDGPDAVRRGQKGRLKIKSGFQRDNNRASGGQRESKDMDLDVDEVREVARTIMRGGRGGSGGASPRSPAGKSFDPRSQRRGLGMAKNRDEGGGGGGRGRGGNGFGGGRGRGDRGGGGRGAGREGGGGRGGGGAGRGRGQGQRFRSGGGVGKKNVSFDRRR